MHRIGAISALRLAATRLQISNGAVIALTKPLDGGATLVGSSRASQ
jgi:hypothetical protein